MKYKTGGFTYIEAIVSLLVIGLVIGPILMAFTTVHKVWYTSTALHESTLYTEALMENIKSQLAQAIKLKRQLEANEEIDEKLKAYDALNLYLETCHKSQGTLRGIEALLIGQDVKEIEALYGTNRYAYEIALWRGDYLDLSQDVLCYTRKNLNQAAKWYSNASYQFTNTDVEMEFELAELHKKLFKEVEYADEVAENVVGAYKIILTQEGLEQAGGTYCNLSDVTGCALKDDKLVLEPSPIKVGHELTGLVYVIKATSLEKGINIIQVDISDLLRQSKSGKRELEAVTTHDEFTLKFINETKQDQVIQVIEGLDSLAAIHEPINIIAIDNSEGKTSIQRVSTPLADESFIITIVVRDMLPLIGEKGKVVKKMIDVYSYDE